MQQRRFNQSKTLEGRLAEKHAKPSRENEARQVVHEWTISARSSRSYASPPIKVGHLGCRQSNSAEHMPQTTEYWELIRTIQPADPPC
jgi:hypothetical protein